VSSFLPAKMNGPIRHVDSLSRLLARRGHDVTVFTALIGVPTGTLLKEKRQGVMIERFKVAGQWGHWTRCPEFGPALERGRFELVHAQSYRNYLTHAAAKVCERAEIPFVLTPRGSLRGFEYLDEGAFSRLPNVAFDFVTRKRPLHCGTIIVTSTQEMNDAIRIGVQREDIRLIPHGFDFASLPQPVAKAEPFAQKLLFVGRLTTQRNLKFLLRAFARARREDTDLKLTIVGDPIPSRHNAKERRYLGELHSLMSSLRLEGSATFLGGRYGEELWDAYMSHDIFVYPSRYDNFGFALLEAAYFGLPIVSTNVGVAGDLLVNGRGGLLVNHDDDEGLANAILQLSQDPKRRLDCSAFLKQQCKLYGMQQNLEAHESLYRTLIL